MNREIVLRLRLKPEAAQAFGFGSARGARVQRFFYDTDDLALYRNGFRLETRNDGAAWIQVLYAFSHGDVAVEENLVETNALDRTKLPVRGEAAARLAEILDGRDLECVFEMALERSPATLSLAESAQIEAVLEKGSIRVGRRRQAVCDLSLKPVSCAPEAFYDWLLERAEQHVLKLEDADPVTRGYALVLDRITPVKAASIALANDLSTEDAFIRIARACLEHHRANLAATLDAQVEGVHQMRVGLRRLRSCLRLFRSLIPKQAGIELVEEICWLNGFLGPARDWDVFIEEGLNPLCARFPEKQALQTLRRKAGSIRRGHYRTLCQTLDEARYHRLLLRLYAWLDTRAWRVALSEEQRRSLEQPVGDFAARLLKKAHKRVRKRGRVFDQLDKEERHELRIRVKQLRYTVEFFSSLYSSKRVSAYKKTLTGLQDCLGVLNDITVAHRLLDEAGAKPVTSVRHLIDGWYGCRLEFEERGFAAAWKRFEGCRRPWK